MIEAYFAFVLFVFFKGFFFVVFISIEPYHHQVEINLMAVKLRPVNANELRLAVDFNAAAAAHPGAVNHNGVQRYLRGNVKLPCNLAAKFHHYSRPNYKGLVRFWGALAKFF